MTIKGCRVSGKSPSVGITSELERGYYIFHCSPSPMCGEDYGSHLVCVSVCLSVCLY